VALPVRRQRKAQFERASDGSMTLMEHLQELRGRLFKASLGVFVGFVIGFFLLAERTLHTLDKPYCDLMRATALKANHGDPLPATYLCPLQAIGITDPFVLQMKVGLWVGLMVAAPIWLYQLWAFIAPGLHRNERRWAYAFAAAAAPLFAIGGVLAYFVVTKGLEFLLSYTPANVQTNLELTGYVGFITNLMLLFGIALEFPLVVVLFNVAGIASAKRLLSWWRVAVFAFFAFSAIATPTPDPFGMSALALVLSALYFAAVGFAFLNDRRRARRHRAEFGEVGDDEISSLEYDPEPVEAGQPVGGVSPIERPAPVERPRPLDNRFDDFT
jgi:sec-independent protein translocase protein TatC